MNDTTLTITGNLVDDPELRFTPSGQPVARFRIASTPRYQDSKTGEWKDGDTLFLTCVVWRQPPRTSPRASPRGCGPSSPGGSASAPTRPRKATSGPSTSSRPTSSGRACGTPRPRCRSSPAPAAATARPRIPGGDADPWDNEPASGSDEPPS